jgi:serine/threonine protein kinase
MICPICQTSNAADAKTCVGCRATLAGSTPAAGAAVPLSPALPAGTKLQNNAYTVGQVLGQGGFGITYKGGDMALRRFVAIKEFYPPGCARAPSLHTIAPTSGSADDFSNSKKRFLEEARTLARFNHPGIVRVYGVFEENNTAYMVMEFLEGQTLAARLKKSVLNESEVVALAKSIGGALEVVHGANLIHRDLKPDNIFLAKDERVVLIDFGTARAYAMGKTVRQTAMLTPGYAPLEQYGTAARFGAYSDVYALAATLYHAATGQAPPPATDRVTGVETPRADVVNPNLSQTLGKALDWGMQIKAENRPQSVAEFLGALSGQGVPRLQPATPSPPTQHAPPFHSAPTVAVGDAGAGSTPGAPLWVRADGDGQLVTNADPYRTLEALGKAMRVKKVNNVTPNAQTLSISGSTNASIASWGQQVSGEVRPGAHGTQVSLRVQNSAHALSDFGKGKTLLQEILRATEVALKTDPNATQPSAPPAPYPQNVPPPIPSPNAYPSYAPNAPRMVQGGKGAGVLTLGILGLFCCTILAPIAWVKGNEALQEYGDQDPGDRGSVLAGRMMGIIGTLLLIAVIVLRAVFSSS